ncbi:MAG: hypothetical protein JJ992_11780 [Planctomycetes bacterium]|nr:hypothetical protein [Planctomycetota bacterium]
MKTVSCCRSELSKAIVDLLCKSLGLRKSQIELIGGHTSSEKRFLIRDLSESELRNRLASAVEQEE